MTHARIPTLPPHVRPLAPARRVRVILEGDARPLAHDPDLLRIEGLGRVVVIDTRALGVAVEDVEPPRVWTDGDVVQIHSSAPYVAHRVDGKWPTTSGGVLDDSHMDFVLAGRSVARATVLRYQHGDA